MKTIRNIDLQHPFIIFYIVGKKSNVGTWVFVYNNFKKCNFQTIQYFIDINQSETTIIN